MTQKETRFLLSFTILVLCCLVRESWERQRSTNCRRNWDCRRYGSRSRHVCCRGKCNSTCPGMKCRYSWHCVGNDKCCKGICKTTCEGSRCGGDSDCSDRSLKCCSKICRKGSCLGSTCDPLRPAHRTCGRHGRRRLRCCNGTCDLSCLDKLCAKNIECGGRSNRLKCCNGACKRSCQGLPCQERKDCHSEYLECCGNFENKTCQRTCQGRECYSNDDCREWQESRYRPRLYCCGDERCRQNCVGSICYPDTVKYDCAGPRTLYCCGMGEKMCRRSCTGVICRTNEDCGPYYYFCGNYRNPELNSTCTLNMFPNYFYVLNPDDP